MAKMADGRCEGKQKNTARKSKLLAKDISTKREQEKKMVSQNDFFTSCSSNPSRNGD